MTHEHRLRFKTLVMVLLMVVCANTGDLLLKRGMMQIGEVRISTAGLWQALGTRSAPVKAVLMDQARIAGLNS